MPPTIENTVPHTKEMPLAAPLLLVNLERTKRDLYQWKDTIGKPLLIFVLPGLLTLGEHAKKGSAVSFTALEQNLMVHWRKFRAPQIPGSRQ